MRLRITACESHDEGRKAVAEFHLRQVALRSVITHFPKASIGIDIADLLVTSRSGLEPLRFADQMDPLLGDDPIRFHIELQEWIGTEALAYPGSGHSTARGSGEGTAKIEWKTEPVVDHGQGVSGTRLYMTSPLSEASYEFNLLREHGERWQLVSMRKLQNQR